MKTKLLYIIILLSLNSCNFLDTTPRDTLNPETFYETEGQMEAAVAGVYDILGRGQLYAYTFQTRLASEADEGFFKSTSRTTGPQFYNLTSSDAEVLSLWSTLYEGINKANIVIANIEKPDMSETKRNQIHGEALFLRSYYYFLLVANWGGVPLVLDPTTSPTGNSIARSSAEKVYEQITQDMIKAEAMVPTINAVGIGGRVNKSAVRGILARVYLYWAGYPVRNTAKYEDARLWSKKVIDDTDANHALNPSYSQVFINYAEDKYDIKESIFEVEFATTGKFEHGQVGSWIGISTSNVEIGTAYGWIGPLPQLYDSYDADDLRRDRAIAPFSYNADGTKKYWTTATKYGKSVGKWRREEELARPKLAQNTPINFALLRYSDVLLMFAEAENEFYNGPTQDAIDAVNLVRERAWSSGIKSITVDDGGSGYTSAPTITITGGGGSEVIATANRSSAGVITSIVLAPDPNTGTMRGSDYTSAPTITISGGGGTGATATATISTKADAHITVSDKTSFNEIIRKERSYELCFEGMRKYDLVRWNLLGQTLNQRASEIASTAPSTYQYAVLSFSNFEPRNLLLPIPISEISLNKELTQNPGW